MIVVLLGVTVLLSAACKAVTPGSSETTTPIGEASYSLSVDAHPENTLMAVVTVESVNDAAVTIEFESEGIAARQIVSSEVAKNHQVIAVGLRAETEYRFWVTGSDKESEAVTFTTGALPAEAPEVLVKTSENSSDEGITFFGLVAPKGTDLEGPIYYGVDVDGYVVWYLHRTHDRPGDPVIRSLGDGQILAFFEDTVERLTLDGETLTTYEVSAAENQHHDTVLTADGGLMFLSREVRTIDGSEIQGDIIIERDAEGSVIWEWSSFDHLDLARFPGPLSNSESPSTGAIDWSHANSVFYDEESQQVLVSLRSQNWVVNIDRTSGDILWIAGESTGISDDFSAPFLDLQSGSWTSGQHAATWTDSGELLVYDNRNETGGEQNNSRAVIYNVDAEALTAEQIFEYSTDKYTMSLGDTDELANGNIMVTAGGPGSSDTALLVEVDRDNNVLWEASTPGRIYRSERISWSELSDGSYQALDEDTEPTIEPGVDGEVEDITDTVLTSTSANCGEYIGKYRSEITDTDSGQNFVGTIMIEGDSESCTIRSNQIPNHNTGEDASFAHPIAEVDGIFEITATPSVADQPTPLDFNINSVMLNGVIWEAYPAACFGVGDGKLGQEKVGCPGSQLDNPWRYNLGSPLSTFALDAFSAHVQADGRYHYHSTPQALYERECDGKENSPVIGFARDGFPIYGPCFTDDGDIRSAQSSYQLKTGTREPVDGFTTPSVVGNVTTEEYNGQFIGDYKFVDGVGDLDECNGMTVDGQYGYYITEEYPYVLGCYSGTPAKEFG